MGKSTATARRWAGPDRGFTSLVVGDGKQSIYRWRGANVQQFVNLATGGGGPGTTDAERTIYRERTPKNLETNYRSGRAVVDFNNGLFEGLKSYALGHEEVYKGLQQEVSKSFEGRVEVLPILGRNKEEREPVRDAFMTRKIQSLVESGFEYRDMTILVRGRKTAHAMSELLQASAIPFTTHESLLLRTSQDVRVLVDALRLVHSSDDEQAAVRLMAMKSQEHENPAGWMSSYLKRDSPGYRNVLDGQRILTEIIGCERPEALKGLTCFEQLEVLALTLSIQTDPMVEALLEAARALAESGRTSVADMLDWWESHKESFSATTSASSDAVLISTVHKSKGLQYPVVFLPLVQPYNGSGTVWVNSSFSEHKLPATYKHSKKDPFPQFPDETAWRKLDELNVLYVATTRAEQQLIITAEITSETGDTLNNALINRLDALDMQVEDGVYSTGSLEAVAFNRDNSKDRRIPWITQPWRGKIKVAFQHERYQRDNQRSEGSRLHALLADVTDMESLDPALEKHIREGWASSDERDALLHSLQELCSHPKARAWYSGEADVLSEQTLLGTSEVLRPDRVMIFADRVEVVDYKTGEPRKSDQKQVRNYCDVLSNMYTRPVHGFLYYTAESIIEAVD